MPISQFSSVRAALVALCVLPLQACRASETAPPQRGNEPWVVRATLDGKPRMLILALHPRLWVAYDAQRASLYRVCPDGINFDGAVYNSHHGPQPATQGETALTSDFPEPWHLMRGEDDLRPRVQYRGHRFESGHVVLRYTLSLPDGKQIEVEERPEVREDRERGPVLERRFKVRGVPDESQLAMDFNAPSLLSTDDVRLSQQGDMMVGRFLLDADDETTLSMSFNAHARVETKEASGQPPGLRLMAASDCSTCHNPESRTVGPSYKEIAERYKTNDNVVAGLATKIRQGGGDLWGDAAMVAHPKLSAEDAATIAQYILTTFDPQDAHGDVATHPLGGDFTPGPTIDVAKLVPGVAVELFEIGHPLTSLPLLPDETAPNTAFLGSRLHFETPEHFRRDEASTGFVMRVRGVLEVDEPGDYDFRLEHDGVAGFTIDEWKLIRDMGATERRLSPWVSIQLEKGLHAFELLYSSSAERPFLSLGWEPPGGALGAIPEAALSTLPLDVTRRERGLKPYRLEPAIAGHASPLTGVHPSFALSSIRPHDFKPMVGGMDFLSRDRAIISTWDPRGSVYEVSHLDAPDPEQVQVRRIAEGLCEPLGLKVVDGEIYVLQKHELTRLVDHDKDGSIDDYQTVSNGWGSTGNFHEFAFGLAYRDGFFYATLAIGIEPGGAAMTQQHPDRGRVIRIAKDTGEVTFIARGLRTPNGIGFGVDGELFVTDNEGDWLPANKLVHVRPDAFFGSFSVQPEITRQLPIAPPALWLPVTEMANSPSQPLLLDVGPYKQQMLFADVTYGGLNRVVLHKVEGQYQGCALPFTQGFEAGINRAVTGPDGAIYVGGIGNPGNWAQEHKLWYGLERLSYTGAPTFEMLDLMPRADGIEITFTEPLHPGDGDAPEDYELRQWRYVPTADYGGPKVDEHELGVHTVEVSQDRRSVTLRAEGLKVEHVLHVRLRRPPTAESGRALWSGDAFCTLNTLPSAAPAPAAPTVVAHNALTEAERAYGAQLLFDGKSMTGFRAHAGHQRKGWVIENGWLTTKGEHGTDLVSEALFGDFELELEWKVAPGANGGVFYRATDAFPELWRSALEMQIVDDDARPDAILAQHRSGAAYDLYAPTLSAARKVGEINHARIVARGTHVEHWLNGHKVLSYELASPQHQRQLQRSKFADIPAFGAAARGRIGLQHHKGGVSYRSIKVRPLPESTEMTAAAGVPTP